MAKAILGYMNGTHDPRIAARLTAENRRLRQRVEDLEAMVLRLQSQNDALVASTVDPHELLALDDTMQPA